MKFSIAHQNIEKLDHDLVVLGSFEDKLNDLDSFKELNKALSGQLGRIIEDEDFTAKEGAVLLVHTLEQLPCARLLLVGLGKREEFQVPDTRRYAATAVAESIRRGCQSMAMVMPPLDSTAQESSVQFLVEGALMGAYRFERYLEQGAQTKNKLQSIHLVLNYHRPEGDPSSSFSLAIAKGEILADAVNWTRDLVNEPAGCMTPTRLADLAQELAKDRNLAIKVLGPKECEKQQMRLLLAVAAGSSEEPRFIHLIYTPPGKEKPKRRIALAGKGVTFDSGGLSIKTGSHMMGMKTDMAGAAAVLGAARALPKLGITSTEVHFLIPATENMISGAAVKVGDVITGLGNKSVEICNTDAEGRLILADALSYANKLGVDEVIDIATLTGACMVALGPHIAGLMGTDRAMVERFLACSRRVGEDFWHLPLPVRLREELKSPVADLKNIGERYGGALTAGLFLKEFADKAPWIHLDIAGPAAVDKAWGHIPKGGTGFGVVSLLEYLRSRE